MPGLVFFNVMLNKALLVRRHPWSAATHSLVLVGGCLRIPFPGIGDTIC